MRTTSRKRRPERGAAVAPKATDPSDVWRCQCGSFEFHLYRCGHIQCAACDLISVEAHCEIRDPASAA
jgi:hypothetical protein